MYDTLIDASELRTELGAPDWVIVDCRFDLGAPESGRANWLEGHIPGAAYVHLDADLSGPPSTDRGRHPLPPPERLVALFSALGIGRGCQVVAYDDAGGPFAARLWWMLRYMGHREVAVLDGGWQAWVAIGGTVAAGEETPRRRAFEGAPRRDRLVLIDDITAGTTLLDARETARFNGDVEPIDPVAGHIPGAANHPWQANLDDNGRFHGAATLASRLSDALEHQADAETTHYCGSGVSACHNVLAQCAAGLPEPRLYVGSWSEWCRMGRGAV